MNRILKLLWLLTGVWALALCSSDKGTPRPPTEISLTVMSSNIAFTDAHNTDEFSWMNRKEAYIAMMKEIAPDIVGMQEPTPKDLHDTEKNRPNQTADLQAALPEYDTFRLYPDDEVEGEPLHDRTGSTMILYRKDKYTLLKSGYFWLSETPDTPQNSYSPFGATDAHSRTALWVHLRDKATQKEFFFLTTHMPFDPSDKATDKDENGKKKYNVVQRQKCAELIVARIKEIAGRNATVFLTGDMNCAYEDTKIYTYAGESHSLNESLKPFDFMWSARQCAPDTDDKDSNNRFDDTKPSSKIDHIFYRIATPQQFRTIDLSYLGVKYISDHYPIVCTFSF